MFVKVLGILLFLMPLFDGNGTTSTYSKTYNNEGKLTAEGWMMGRMKTKYWKFYHENGELASEGHFKNNQKEGYWYFYDEQNRPIKEGHYEEGIAENWWIFYDLAQQKMLKIQYENNQKNGYGLLYHKKKLVQAMKYVSDQKTGEWHDLKSFRQDNPNASLY